MRCKLVLSLFMVSLAVSSAAAQAVKDPARLMPEKTLAYAEVRQIGKLAKEFSGLFKGSVLGDLPDSMQNLHDKYAKDLNVYYRSGPVGMFGMPFSPEVVAELGKIDGAAIAFTGMAGEDNPEFLAVVLPGQSNVPGFFMRAMLTAAPVRRVETVEGVSVYGVEHHHYFKTMKPGERPKPPEVTVGLPYMAMAPGAMFIGSQANVRDAIMRLKGKTKTSLALNPTFLEARKVTEGKPGVFAYAEPAELAQALLKFEPRNYGPKYGDIAREAPPFGNEKDPDFQKRMQEYEKRIKEREQRMKEQAERWAKEAKERRQAERLAMQHLTKGVRAVSKSWTLDQGKLAGHALALLEKDCPLHDLMPVKALDTDLLHFAPSDAVLALAMDNSDGEMRWKNLLTFADGFPSPGGHKFSDDMKRLEEAHGFSIGKDVFGDIASAALVMGDLTKMKMKITQVIGPNYRSSYHHQEPPIVVILRAKNDKAAANLFNLAPHWLSGPGKIEPVKTMVEGREIWTMSYKMKERNPDAPVVTREIGAYGREGLTVVVGPSAEAVAKSLNAGAKRQGLLANPESAAMLKSVNGKPAMGLVKPVHLISMMGMYWMRAYPAIHDEFDKPAVADPGSKSVDTKIDGPKIEIPKEKKSEVKWTVKETWEPEDPMLKELGILLAKEEFLVLVLQHTKDKIQIDGTTSGLAKLVPPLTDFLVEAAFRQQARMEQMYRERAKRDQERFEKERARDKERFEKGSDKK